MNLANCKSSNWQTKQQSNFGEFSKCQKFKSSKLNRDAGAYRLNIKLLLISTKMAEKKDKIWVFDRERDSRGPKSENFLLPSFAQSLTLL